MHIIYFVRSDAIRQQFPVIVVEHYKFRVFSKIDRNSMLLFLAGQSVLTCCRPYSKAYSPSNLNIVLADLHKLIILCFWIACHLSKIEHQQF
jgi:hypothetical protein